MRNRRAADNHGNLGIDVRPLYLRTGIYNGGKFASIYYNKKGDPNFASFPHDVDALKFISGLTGINRWEQAGTDLLSGILRRSGENILFIIIRRLVLSCLTDEDVQAYNH